MKPVSQAGLAHDGQQEETQTMGDLNLRRLHDHVQKSSFKMETLKFAFS